MADYVFKFTDPLKAPFVVREFGANGPLNPSSALPLASTAVSANTSLTLVGKGTIDYGKPVQENLIYLTENFANSTPPAYPIEGQVWYNNSVSKDLFVYTGLSTWTPLVINGLLNIPFDANNQLITNVANPLTPSDVVNLGYANASYVQLSGGTMVGFLVLSGDPTLNLHAATKQYVDSEIAIVSGSTTTIGDKVDKAGDTMTGPLVIDNTTIDIINSSSIQVVGGSIVMSGVSTLDLGTNRISSVGAPMAAADAATKQYVDDTAITITDATHNLNTGIVTLTTDAASISLPGAPLAPFTHTHIAGAVGYIPFDNTVPHSAILDYYTLLAYGVPSLTALDTALNILSTNIHSLTTKTNRYVAVGNSTTTMTLPFKYPVNMDKLSVYKNGIKLYRQERAHASISLSTPILLTTVSTLGPGTYAYNITIDGTLFSNRTIDLSSLPVSTFALFSEVVRRFASSLATSASTTVTFSAPLTLLTASTGLMAGTLYRADVVVNGVTYTVTVDGSTALTYADLFTQLQIQSPFSIPSIFSGTLKVDTISLGSESNILLTDTPSGPILALFASLTNFTAITLPVAGTTTATVFLDDDGTIKVMSPTVGTGSSVTLAAPSSGTNVFTSLGATFSNQSISTTYDYSETGVPMRFSTTVTFPAITSAADKYEFLVSPHATHTDANGNFV